MAIEDSSIEESVQHNPKFPARFYVYKGIRRDTYFQIDKNNKRINLGHDLTDALDFHEKINNSFGRGKEASTTYSPSHAIDLWKACKKNSTPRGISFDLTLEDVERLVARSKSKCEVTGIKFNNTKPKGMRVRPWRESIDRKNNALGYTYENCRIVCTSVNLAMNQFGEDFFGTLLEALLMVKLEPIVDAILQRKIAELGKQLK